MQWQRHCPPQIILLTEIFQVTWAERTMVVFQRAKFTYLVDHVIWHALLQGETLQEITVSAKKLKTLGLSRDALVTLLKRYVVHSNRQLED